jgi:hypothetical protein
VTSRFAALRFNDALHVQPLEHLRCHAWGGGEPGDKYLASDMMAEVTMPPDEEAE